MALSLSPSCWSGLCHRAWEPPRWSHNLFNWGSCLFLLQHLKNVKYPGLDVGPIIFGFEIWNNFMYKFGTLISHMYWLYIAILMIYCKYSGFYYFMVQEIKSPKIEVSRGLHSGENLFPCFFSFQNCQCLQIASLLPSPQPLCPSWLLLRDCHCPASLF